MNPFSELPLTLACGVTLAAAWMDAKMGRIPNALTLPVLAVGLVFGALNGGLRGLGSTALGALLCLAVPYGLFWASRGTAIGGGDVKLFATLGALLGPIAGLEVELASLLLLAACALVTLAWRGELFTWLKHTALTALHSAVPMLGQRPTPQDQSFTLRLGPAICFATWSLALLQRVPASLLL